MAGFDEIRNISRSFESEIVNFLREIIAIPSFNSEKDVIDRIRLEMEDVGYDEIRIDSMGNLIGRLGNGSRSIAIDGHCDTVSIGNPANWEIDPLKGRYDEGYVYGRGATDQKGGIASMIYSAKILQQTGVPDDITIWHVVSIREEEYEGVNWQYLVREEKLKPDIVLLTEPTNLDICVGQRGRVDIKVKTKGVSCHGANPHLGENAIYKMTPILRDIEKMNSKFPEIDILGKGTITVTGINSTAPSINAVADSAEIHIDRRLTKGDTLESAVNEIEKLSSVLEADAEVYVPEFTIKTYTGLEYPGKAYYATWLLEKTHPAVRNAIDTYELLFNKKPDVRPWNFSTNGVATRGIFDIPTIGLGPSDELLAHTTEEKVSAQHLTDAAAFYASFVKNYNLE
ncbi:MAG: YgeY family selenium metabolism-linked hydrolase [bacterium]|nr:YgeY family selenium metabolism-linked hydrolase [bacterium]